MVIFIKQARRKERRRLGRRKGQFFVLGAVLICSLFFIGLPLYGPQVQAYKKDLSYVSANLESEFPRALNLALRSGSVQSFADFSRFSQGTLAGQNIRLRALWLASEPWEDGVQVTVGNFMGKDLEVNITVGAEFRGIQIQDNLTVTALFSSVPDSYDMVVEFPGHSKSITWLRNKASLYSYQEVSRGADLVVEEIEG
jgi:hypothetical protein